MAKAKIDRKNFDRDMRKFEKVFDDLPHEAHKEFIRQTPKRSGNARRNTILQKTTIVANYPYAEQLDAGSSKQNPQGMTEPTEKWIRNEINRRLRGL